MNLPLKKRVDLEVSRLSKEHPKWVRLLIESIVKLRRNIDTQASFNAFDSIVRSNLNDVIINLNDRWVNSIIDTYVDHGNDQQKPQALILSQFICNMNAMKLCLCNTCGCNINGSLIVGDKFSNLFKRIDTVINDPILSAIWFNKYRNDLLANKTVWRNLAQHSIVGLYKRIATFAEVPLMLNSRSNKKILIISETGETYESFVKSLLYQPSINIVLQKNPKQINQILENQKEFKVDTAIIFGDAIFKINLNKFLNIVNDLVIGQNGKDLMRKYVIGEFDLFHFSTRKGWIFKVNN